MAVALRTAEESTCLRLKVGCALLDAKGRLVTVNYNGTAAGQPHCTEKTCNDTLGTCDAIHAEQNSLLYCSDVWKIKVCLVTVAPCFTCTKLLLNTSCKFIFYYQAHPVQGHSRAERLWRDAGRHWYHFPHELKEIQL